MAENQISSSSIVHGIFEKQVGYEICNNNTNYNFQLINDAKRIWQGEEIQACE